MRNARIISSGSATPQWELDNAYFDELLGIDVSTWLEENAQIFTRRWVTEEESTSTLAVEAATRCLERAGVSPKDLDLIIVATDTPDYLSPSTASVVQYRLGAQRANAFDVNAACAGFVNALEMGSRYIQSDAAYQKVLVIGAYAMSRHLNQEDKKTVTLFADGAGAILLSSQETDAGFQAAKSWSEGQYWDYMGVYAGGTVRPVDAPVINAHAHHLVFAKKFPPELNPDNWSGMARDLCTKMGVTPGDIDQYFITQININAIHATLDLLEVPREKAHNIMHTYGYTGSACIPMAFDDAWQKNLIQAGDRILFLSSGGGLAFSGAAFIL